ncbi:phosphoglycolate phosphatase [Thorsellia anophelis]|uniref:phosphoglycolate phosphatase n=1 Tax=Thorsellia anophelis DSM 18579 TaxID=1123402 RepID=A0A1H9Y4M5_9GAMM|nr:phosphoglycolate phosphatase [Thorsellia anophelis]SES63827.1 phosphoglycolate phosphatase [Thorsellia anophelis DSM 18579]
MYNQTHMIKAIAFDLDGTLVDSLPGLHSALNSALQDLNLHQVTALDVKGWIGNGIDVLLSRAIHSILPNDTLTSEEIKSLRSSFDLHYETTMISGTHLFDGVIKTLNELKKSQIKLAIVTNKPSQFLPGILNDLGLSNFFSIVLGADDVTVKKPHPAPLYSVLSQFGFYAQELLFVGDSKNDIQCAKSAGCLSAGLTYGYNYHEPIEASNPDFLLNDFPALLNIDKLMK